MTTEPLHENGWEAWMGILIRFTQSGMNQKEFASKVGWTASKVSRVLAGKAPVRDQDIRDARHVLGGSLDYYIDGPGGAFPPLIGKPHNPRDGKLGAWFGRPIDIPVAA